MVTGLVVVVEVVGTTVVVVVVIVLVVVVIVVVVAVVGTVPTKRSETALFFRLKKVQGVLKWLHHPVLKYVML